MSDHETTLRAYHAEWQREMDATMGAGSLHGGRDPELAAACRAGADALRREPRYRAVLEQLATNELSDENCASVEVAGARVRGLARQALNAPTEPTL